MGKSKGYSNRQFFGLVAVVLIAIVAVVAVMQGKAPQTAGTTLPTGQATAEGLGDPTVCVAGDCKTDPTMSYSVVNAFTSAAVTGGTDYIKQNDAAPVSSLTNPRKCDKLEYWHNIGTHFVDVTTIEEVGCGSGQIMQGIAYPNASVTLTAYDQYTQLTAGGGASNLTLGANGVKNVEYRWEGTAKQSAMPFGGCVVIEYPSSLSYAKPSGSGLSDTGCQHKVTYTVSTTSNTYSVYDVPEGFDADGMGDVKSFNVQYKAGSSDPSGTAIVTFYPANYYLTEEGDFTLGVEKDENDDTTKTFNSSIDLTIAMD